MGRVLLWAVLGLILGGALAFGLGLFWLTYINTDQREGAAARMARALLVHGRWLAGEDKSLRMRRAPGGAHLIANSAGNCLSFPRWHRKRRVSFPFPIVAWRIAYLHPRNSTAN